MLFTAGVVIVVVVVVGGGGGVADVVAVVAVLLLLLLLLLLPLLLLLGCRPLITKGNCLQNAGIDSTSPCTRIENTNSSDAVVALFMNSHWQLDGSSANQPQTNTATRNRACCCCLLLLPVTCQLKNPPSIVDAAATS